MLPTFVIGLREGLEASLIVGIVAAFLMQQGRRDALKKMWAGVILAVVLCAGAGVLLQVINKDLPQRQQEMLETVVALLAVGMVTYMIIFMKRHSKNLKGELESRAGDALASGSAGALILMAFLAVMREGLETAVFLLAAFQASTSPAAAGAGAVIGIVVACGIGYGIYKGGVRINLSRFFRVTGFVLVLVAAGLCAFAAHTAHEAGWITNDWLLSEFADFSSFIKAGNVSGALVTGVLGIQPQPTWSEALAWIIYFVPMATIVLWPQARRAKGSTSEAAPSVPVAA